MKKILLGLSICVLSLGLAVGDAEAKRLGMVMSTEDAAAAAELNDAFDRVTRALKMTAVAIGSALAPMPRASLPFTSALSLSIQQAL